MDFDDTKIIEIPFHKVKINFLDPTGGKDVKYPLSYLFTIEADGINPKGVRKVEFPTLDYSSNSKKVLYVKIHYSEIQANS